MNLPAMHLISRFHHIVAAKPHAIAVADQTNQEQAKNDQTKHGQEQGNTRLTYADLNAQSNRIAQQLLAQHIAPETCIGVQAGRTPAMLVAILGILKAGGCYVPVAPHLPAARQQQIIDATQMNWLIKEDEDPALIDNNLIDNSLVLLNTETGETANCANNANTNKVPDISADSLAYIMFTSGSTGTPKGVMIEHGNVLNLVDGLQTLFKSKADLATEKVLLLGSIGFDATSFEIWFTLLSGGTLVTISDADRINPVQLKAHIKAHGITTLFMPTGFCQQLLNDTPTVFSALNKLLIGGDKLHPGTITTLREHAPQTRLFNVYGPTENTVFTTAFEILPNLNLSSENSIPIGSPLSGCEVAIENTQGQTVPAGETGELILRGKQVCRGYINTNNDQSAQTVEKREYRSGDLGYINPNGALVFVARKDHQVKINGYRIEPGEVEHALLQLENVNQAVVKALELAEKPEENPAETPTAQQQKMLVAWVVLSINSAQNRQSMASDNALSKQQSLQQALQQQLPDYMLPSEIVIVERFALDNNGKIDRNALVQPSSHPEPNSNIANNTSSQSLADIETQVQKVFSKALKHQVSLSDDFFDLGGNSITALKIFGKLKGLNIKLSDIMHYRTAGKLAAHAYANLAASETNPKPETSANSEKTETPEIRNTPEKTPDLAAFAADAIKQIRADYQLNNQRIRQWQPGQRIAFSPIQNLQASFTVPMSLGVCDIKLTAVSGSQNTNQKITKLQHAIARTINKHELLRSTPLLQASRDGEVQPVDLKLGNVKSRYFQSYQPQSVNSEQMLRASVVDLSAYHLSDDDFLETGKHIVSDLQCNGAGAAPDLMCHFVIIRRSDTQYYIVSIVHHSLFDRCSDELLQRDFRRFCFENKEFENRELEGRGLEETGLLETESEEKGGKKSTAPTSASFAHYVNTLNSGPQHASQADIIQGAALNNFHQYKTQALESEHLQPSQTAQNFDIAVPLPASVTSELPVGAAAAIYSNAICHTYQWQGIPMLFIYEARRYLNQDYYDVLGELIDYVPIALTRDISLPDAQSRVLSQLQFANQYNVNFLKLMLENPAHASSAIASPALETDQIHPLIYPGDNLQHIDFTMFNFLGNAEPGVSYRDHYNDTVQTAPHPLPIQSFLNCIVTCYHDGLLYKIRGSYQTDVSQLREAFVNAAEKWAGIH